MNPGGQNSNHKLPQMSEMRQYKHLLHCISSLERLPDCRQLRLSGGRYLQALPPLQLAGTNDISHFLDHVIALHGKGSMPAVLLLSTTEIRV